MLISYVNGIKCVSLFSFILLYVTTTQAAEKWDEICVIPHMRPGHFVKYPIDLSFEKSSQALLTDQSGRNYAFLKMPECSVTPIDDLGGAFFMLPNGTYLGKHEVLAPGGSYLFQEQTWHVGNVNTKTRIPQNPPENFPSLNPSSKNLICRPDPVLSTDGLWIAWIEKTPGIEDIFIYGHGTHFTPRIVVRSIDGKKSLRVHLPNNSLMDISNCEGLELLALDMNKRQAIVSIHSFTREFPFRVSSPIYYAINIDQNEASLIAEIKEIKDKQHFRLLENGWIAWGNVDDLSSFSKKIVWSLPSGRKTYEVKFTGIKAMLGSQTIDKVTVSPNGRWLAVSFRGSLTRGVNFESTYVLRTRDSQVMFEHSKSADTAFLGNDFFAYGEYSYEKRLHQTHVLKLPKE